MTGHAHLEDMTAATESLTLHFPHNFLDDILQRDLELHQRLSRNAIGSLCERLLRTNAERSKIGDRHGRLLADIEEARRELNDARMLRSMRGDDVE